MNTLWQDLRYGARMLWKQPGFTLIAVVTLSLGIGANTAIFTLVNAYLLRPLPVKEPQQLVVLATKDQRLEVPYEVSFPNYEDIRNLREVFSDAIAFSSNTVNLNQGEQAERIWVALVTGNYFSLLGVEALRGRTFLPEEGRVPAAQAVVVLSYDCWQRRFGADPSVVGKTVKLNNRLVTVVGIAPANFPGTDPLLAMEAYLPVGLMEQLYPGSGASLKQRDQAQFRVLGRLQPGVSIEQARAGTTVLARQLEQEYPQANKGVSFALAREADARPTIAVARTAPRIAAVFMALIGLVLLVACANVANLMLARAAARQREIATRAALGAGRWRLIRQLLTESLLLSAFGAGGGLLLALWASDWLASIKVSVDAPVRFDFHPDWRVFGFTALATLVTALITGVAPSFQASKLNLSEALKEGGRGAAGSVGRQRLRSLLVISQVAVSLVVLLCAGLFVRSAKNAERIDLGFRTEKLLLLSLNVGMQGYDQRQGAQFYQQLLERVKTLPGVLSASLAARVPLGYNNQTMDVFLPGRTPAAEEDRLHVFTNVVGPDYFRTLGTPLLQGREFAAQDDESAPKVAIINQAMAQRYWPQQDPLGQRFRLSRAGAEVQIVGVAKDAKYLFLSEEPRPYLYLPLAQNYQAALTLHLHTASEPAKLVAPVRQVVRALDKTLPLYDVKTMTAHLRDGQALLFVRLGATLVSAFGLLGLSLAAVGLYGVLAYSVTQRTHELGLRLALGAQPRAVFQLVIGQGMRLTLLGVVIGLAAAFALTRLFASLLYGVGATDPATFIVIPFVLSGVALLACWLPARRATKVDPMIALRTE